MARQVIDEFLTKKQSGSARLVVLPNSSVSAYERGATASAAGSGTTVTVFGLGTIGVGDIVSVNGSATEIATVQSVAGNGLSFVHNNSNLSWSRLDRFVNTSHVAVITEDPEGTSTLTQPVEAEDDGRITVYVSTSVPVDLKIVDEVGGIIIKPDWGAVVGGVPTFRPEDYGSVITAAQTAINAAITAANAAGGGIVQLDARTYPLTATVTLLEKVWLRGSGKGVTILQIGAAANCDVLSLTAGGNFCRVSDLTVDGNVDNQTANSGGKGLFVRDTNFVEISSVESKETGAHGIWVQANTGDVASVSIHDCDVHDTGQDTNASSYDGIALSAASSRTIQRASVRSNVIRAVGPASGATATANGISVSGAGSCSRIAVTDNIIETVWSNGIRLNSTCDQLSVIGNHIKDAGQRNNTDGGNGIFLSTASKIQVIGNSVSGVAASSDNGIEISGLTGDCVIAMNRVTGVANATKAGINCGSTLSLCVTDNEVHDVTGLGIDAQVSSGTSAKRIVIRGNNIDTTGSHGIRAGGGEDYTITGNSVFSAGVHGIIVTDSDAQALNQALVTNNTIRDAAADGIRVASLTSGLGINRLVVAQNLIYSPVDDGIIVAANAGTDANQVSIIGNIIEDCGENAINLNSGIVDFLVTGNICRNFGTDGGTETNGVNFTGAATDGLITGNEFTDSTGSGRSSIDTNGNTMTRVYARNNHMTGCTLDGYFNAGARVPSDTLTIATGVLALPVTGLQVQHYLVAGEGAAADTLDSITGGDIGSILVLTPASDSVTIKVAHSATIALDAGDDFDLDTTNDALVLMRISATAWLQLAACSNQSTETLTIVSGVLTIPNGPRPMQHFLVAGETSPDDLDSIAGGSVGSIIVLTAADDAVTITAINNATTLYLSGSNMALDNARDTLTLLKLSATVWIEVARSNNGA